MAHSKVRLPIKVIAGSSRSGIAGWLGEVLRVRVTAPAERGQANVAVEALLREAFGLPAGGVKIVSGGASPRKMVEVIGLSKSEIRRRVPGVPNNTLQATPKTPSAAYSRSRAAAGGPQRKR